MSRPRRGRHARALRNGWDALEQRTLMNADPGALGQVSASSAWASRTVLVKLTDPVAPTPQAVAAIEALQGELRTDLGQGVRVLVLPEGASTAEAVRVLKGTPGVVYAESNRVVRPAYIPNDPSFSAEWGLNSTPVNYDQDINAPDAWNITKGSPTVTVAVTDTGVDYTHEDLYLNIRLNAGEIPSVVHGAPTVMMADTNGDGQKDFWDLNSLNAQGVPLNSSGTPIPGLALNLRMNAVFSTDVNSNGRIDGGDLLGDSHWNNGVDEDGNTFKDDLVGWNFYADTNNPYDDHNHGTHVAGTAVGVGDNGVGTTGVAYNARILPVKFIGANGEGTSEDGILSINYAAQRGARIINASWGDMAAPGDTDQATADAITAAGALGSVFIAAAGNNGAYIDVNTFYPAGHLLPNLISVAAIDPSGQFSGYSNYGTLRVQIAAPGSSILSTVPGGYGYSSGTSMAAPHVSGVGALVVSRFPSLTPAQVVTQILQNGRAFPPAVGKTSTGTILDAYLAVQSPVTTLNVTSVTSTTSGVTLTFSRPLDPTTLNLYDNATGALGAADVTLVGSSTGPIRGTLVLSNDRRSATFVKTGGILLASTYTLTLRSASNGFKDSTGGLLDGNSDGVTGDNFSTFFNLSASSTRVLSLPDFTRGPAQPVNVPASGAGLPLSISDGSGVTSVSVRILYDPTLLTITGSSAGPDAPGGASVTINTSTPGEAIVNYSGPALPAGPAQFVSLTATVPSGVTYSLKQVIRLDQISVNGGSVTAIGDQAVHVVGYLGDANGNGRITAADATLINRVAASLDGGFTAYQLADPILVGDVNGSSSITGTDATLANRFAASIPTPQIPAIPPGTVTPSAEIDPRLWLPRGLVARPGQVLTVPVLVENTDTVPISISTVDLAIGLDPSAFRVLNVAGAAPDAGTARAWAYHASSGVLIVSVADPTTPVTLEPGEQATLAILQLYVRPGSRPGDRSLNLLESAYVSGAERFTALNDGRLLLIPGPSNDPNDPNDGVLSLRRSRPAVIDVVGQAAANGGLTTSAPTPRGPAGLQRNRFRSRLIRVSR